jgi:predicted metalloprotease with PDZ domain
MIHRGALAAAVLAVAACVRAAAGEASDKDTALAVTRGTAAVQDVPYPGVITLKVDITDVERRLFTVRESLPVSAGTLTLLYPEWLPGNHAPRGPIEGLAGLTAIAGGRPVAWRRDPLNVYAFHLDVPAGVSRLDLTFQFASPLLREQGRAMVTPDIAGLQWNTVILYPDGYLVWQIPVSATVVLPESWGFGCALDVEAHHGGTVQFGRTSLATLVDSPLFAGRYFKSVDLTPGAREPVRLDVVADSSGSLEMSAAQIAAHRKLIEEAYALFGARHFDHYDLLLALSEHFGEIGLEHHRSSENRRSPGYFVDWERGALGRELLPHELVHSWNGKFRLPAGLATPNFNVPMQDSLLWVYEGLTNYLGHVLAARSGLWSAELTRDAWAYQAASMDRDRPGRAWRDLEDTTDQPIITPRRPLSWPSWQRGEDYYVEGELVWLDVDTQLRELSGDKRSLDDFARAFFGVGDGDIGPVTYTFDDIVRSLNSVVPFDWGKFLDQRVHSAGSAPIEGLARGGWRLVYGETRSDYMKSFEQQRGTADFIFSIGMSVGVYPGAQVTEVRWGGPAYEAGLTIGMTVVAVNGREYRQEWLREAIASAKVTRTPVELIVKDLDRYRVVKIPYYEGLKYPHLERSGRNLDRLGAIVQPRVKE